MFPARPTIVIVDDDLNIGRSLKRGLATYGYHTEMFGSSAECLNAIVTSVAACFVIDVQLGPECGIELAQKLSDKGIKSPVIHMSGANNEAVRRAALASRSFAFLDKPFLMPKLVRAIEGATRRISTP
ncbi:MAG TPA: response regulator [Rhizomicrobium sp.]|nr:response regulator [Rhizomicrobium sp.]